MADSVPLQIADTIQTAHIQRHPSPLHDVNPPHGAGSTAEPVYVDNEGIDEGEEELDTSEEEEYRSSRSAVPRPRKPQHHFPPLPDLRFEQSYLWSIRNADTWWKVVAITVRDQVMMPLLQGIVYNLFICGWQYWNKSAQIHGSSVGARLRRWWYGVNKWPIPPPAQSGRRWR
ncbi:uncharacterized protein CTHT_0023070 [Thermochaetoides thermophila DSM 1495]|uniref:DUF1770 domain-containing protein n=1 Tax=Chaetomium thermophilum (strain DSM 1495 / CBS 144.50 / IMI 039719) TaxID=759272 RepID=G0S4P6_CHATD|nr:hypothetical protein CTHT_0023070 [Thermochaetoides thermophila DSM 1495]EGS20475.1 hypothetical protein CTHT_0023070 [Thermochaetoides thermophila DSM 1495]